MQETPLSEIREKALELHRSGASWHFHCLSPTCQLSDDNRFAFVLESPETNESWVFYSDRAEKELASELSPLLHGSDVMDKDSSGDDYLIPEAVQQMRDLALEMNEKNVAWHHHMLFSTCIFNDHSPKFVLMVEDPRTDTAIKNVTDYEPKEDIKQIESLFFAQS